MNFIRILGSLILVIALKGAAYAKDLGVVGATYPVSEKDALQEIEERARQIDWGKYFNKDKMKKVVTNFKPEDMINLKSTERNTTFTVDMTYTLQHDIPDGKGGILYPKGYTFNPLDYVIFPNTLVFINGSDRRQVDWFKASAYYKDHKVMLLITDGSFNELSEELKRPVYYAKKEIVERFKLRAVPSVVVQKNRKMEVNEIAIKKNEKSS
jgi:conjugal transfer pilus assembly protein TraW